VRVTVALRAVLAELDRVRGFRSAADVHLALRSGGGRIGLSTVYRHLHGLTATGQVEAVHSASGEWLFRRRRAPGHTHALWCRACGAAVEIDDDPLETRLADLAHRNGYGDVEHELILSGVCRHCRTADRRQES
jgi:Fur family ferric uptake transcriptional regulator